MTSVYQVLFRIAVPAFLLLNGLLLAGCKDHGVFNRPYRVINTGPGPEDIALDTSLATPRLIISCSERRTGDFARNGFYVYEIVTGAQNMMVVAGLPDDVTLAPHGIDIAQTDLGTLLYAVNHDKIREEHAVLVFRVGGDTLHYHQTLTHPLMISPNDVCTDHRGGIYVSNDSGKRNGLWEKLWGLRRSYVLHYDGWKWSQGSDRIAYANGVGVHGDRLYVTGTQEKHVIVYKIGPDGLSERQDISAIKGSDNITFHKGRLISTSHLDFLAFMRHVGRSDKRSPCMVYSLALASQRLDTLFTDNGQVISAASTGLIFGDSLYIAQVFDPFVLAVPLR
jgi:arylesterase / paraoxonase